jgi:hypothetical protein
MHVRGRGEGTGSRRKELLMRSERRVRFWVILSVAFVVLQLLDGILTAIGVRMYGLEFEGNPLAALIFGKLGTVQGAIAVKAVSILIFFGILWYCLYVRWSLMDVVGLLWGRAPKRDRAYAMKNFYALAAITIPASLYAGAGWTYVHILLGNAS